MKSTNGLEHFLPSHPDRFSICNHSLPNRLTHFGKEFFYPSVLYRGTTSTPEEVSGSTTEYHWKSFGIIWNKVSLHRNLISTCCFLKFTTHSIFSSGQSIHQVPLKYIHWYRLRLATGDAGGVVSGGRGSFYARFSGEFSYRPGYHSLQSGELPYIWKSPSRVS